MKKNDIIPVWQSRAEPILHSEGLENLNKSRVLIFGLGGVGGACLEAIARAGIGEIAVVDPDTFSPSNLNRQILATRETIGREKATVARERVLAINPGCTVTALCAAYSPENANAFDLAYYDYVIDAVDDVRAKTELAVRCTEANIPLISCMGTGNKTDPTAFYITDISKTSGDPLARAVRIELRKRGINHLKVCISREKPAVPGLTDESGRRIPASVSFVPPVAGYVMAGEVIRTLAGLNTASDKEKTI